jgi:hypothetical protein
MKRGGWEQWRDDDGNVVRYRPSTRTKPGKLAVTLASGVTQIATLSWVPSLISVTRARCPCCQEEMVVRTFSDGSTFVRTLRLERTLTPPDKDDNVPFEDDDASGLSEMDWQLAAVEYAAELREGRGPW